MRRWWNRFAWLLCVAAGLVPLCNSETPERCKLRDVTRLAWPREMNTAGTLIMNLFKAAFNDVKGLNMNMHSFHGTDDIYSRSWNEKGESKNQAQKLGHVIPMPLRDEFVNLTQTWPLPWFWEAHYRFFDFVQGGPRPFTFGFLREPVSRCVSYVSFNKQFSDDVLAGRRRRRRRLAHAPVILDQPPGKHRVQINQTFDEHMRKYIVPSCANTAVLWYCGMNEACNANNAWVAERAMVHIETSFDFLGIVERLPASISLLADLLPDLIPARIVKLQLADMTVIRPSGHFYTLSDHSVAEIQAASTRDKAFYAWNDARLDAKIATCGSERTREAAKIPQTPTYLKTRAARAVTYQNPADADLP